MRLRHRVRTTATPAQVWALLADPSRWPEHDVTVRRVLGSSGPVTSGQHLLAVTRGAGVRIPVDVLEVEPERRLVVRLPIAPGVAEEVTTTIVPHVRGGCDVVVSVVVDGLFARPTALPIWLVNGLTVRVLVLRAERLARAARKAA